MNGGSIASSDEPWLESALLGMMVRLVLLQGLMHDGSMPYLCLSFIAAY